MIRLVIREATTNISSNHNAWEDGTCLAILRFYTIKPLFATRAFPHAIYLKLRIRIGSFTITMATFISPSGVGFFRNPSIFLSAVILAIFRNDRQ